MRDTQHVLGADIITFTSRAAESFAGCIILQHVATAMMETHAGVAEIKLGTENGADKSAPLTLSKVDKLGIIVLDKMWDETHEYNAIVWVNAIGGRNEYFIRATKGSLLPKIMSALQQLFGDVKTYEAEQTQLPNWEDL